MGLITNITQAFVGQTKQDESDYSYRLTIETQGESYFIYGNNELNRIIRKKCNKQESDRKLIDPELDQCLPKDNDDSLSKPRLISYLKTLENRTIEIDTNLYLKTANFVSIYDREEDSSKLKFDAVSTQDEDSSVSIWSERTRSANYAYYYYLTYGGSKSKSWPILEQYDNLLLPFLNEHTDKLSTLDHEVVYREVVSKKYSEFANGYYVFDPNKVSSFAMKDFIYPFALCDLFKDDIKQATDILYKYHDVLTKKQIEILFSGKLVWELITLKDEDPWQDVNACDWAGCSLEDKFERVFKNVSYGVRFLNTPINFPWSWEVASKLHTSIERQGFGPYQVIFGLFKEAAANPEIRSHFNNILNDEYFENDKSMIRAILEKPTLAYAFTLDYILTKLTNTVYKNPKVGALPINPPFIKDEVERRQFAIMINTRLLTGNPEWYTKITKYPYADNTKFFGFFNFVSDVLYGSDGYFLNSVKCEKGKTKINNDGSSKSAVYYFGMPK